MLGFAAPATLSPGTLPEAFIAPQGVATLRIASAGYATATDDTPASTSYIARLLGDVVLSQSALDAVGVGGRVALGLGDIDLWDGDGQMADLVRYGTADGRAVAIRVAPALDPQASDVGSPLAGLPAAWRGVVAGVDGADPLHARLTVADISQLLATPLQSSLYAGTGGLEGPSTLKGSPRPVCLGHVYNITPVALGVHDLGDGGLLTYQSNWRSVAAHDAVRIRGVEQTLVTVAPTVGEYRDWPSLGLFQLGSSPDGVVTCDVRGDNSGGYVSGLAEVLRRLVQVLGPGYADDDIDDDAFTWAASDMPGDIGWYQGASQTSAAAAIDALIAGPGAVLAGGRGGTLRLFDPLASDDTQFALLAPHIIALAPAPLPAGLRPLPRSVAVAWRRNWTPLTDIAGVVSDADRAQLQAAASGPARAASSTITDHVAQQREMSFPGLYWAEADALARAGQWRDWLAAGPRIYTVTTDRYLGQIDCGDIGTVAYPAYGLDAGVRCTVVGWSEQLGARRLTLTLATLPEA
jgi:hypothetical protein